ncbi:hypothetical protein [Streptomyces sp. NPDC051662]|uniref:hypothetical protein n=1 Tax=Streptomyces sp. NPDC051662 TaxID=3154750 RepID=UPI003438EDB6
MHDAGLCVLPIKADGSKAADVRSWKPYKVTRSTEAEHDQWFGDGRRQGIATVYGGVSGNVEMIEFEGHAIADGVLEEVTEIMKASGLGAVWESILTGWATESPSGGRHYRARIDGAQVPGNTKLASCLAREDEYTPQERQRVAEKPTTRIIRVQIGTRGEGGYGLVEPSYGVAHPTGRPYVRLAGGPGSIPTVDADVMAAIRAVCRMLDTLPKQETVKTAPRDIRPAPEGSVRPGEDYEAKTDWADILQSHGWTLVAQHGQTRYWRRPGKDKGLSATTGRDPGRDRLYVFSSSTEFIPEVPYTKFGACALLHHGGDHKGAASALRGQGFGTEPPRRRLAPVGGHFSDGSSALDPAHVPEPDDAPDGALGLRVVAARPELDITNEADAIDGVLMLMADDRLPDLYKRSGGPCWVHEDDNGNPLVQQLGTDNLRAYLADHLTSYTVRKDADGVSEEVRELFLPKTCGTVLGRKDWPLPPLRGIVTSPVIRADGTLLQAPGYDTATGLYLQPRVPLRRLQPQVSADSLARAREIVLDEMLADFPWAQPSDRAHFLGALLTPILRPYFYGPTPMFIISATAPGSGKSLLKDILKYGYGISETAWPENDTELRKSITTQLYTTGQPVVVLDNLPNGHIVKSPVLSSLLTAEHWGDRVLGSTASVTMLNDKLWILTGNGLRTGGDNARRTMWVRLDPNVPDPDQRDGFRVGDLRPWLRSNASTVVAALVTMVRAWLAAGAQTVRTRKGDYSEWATMLAGLLAFLGVPGWMADRDDAIQQDDELLEWISFLTAWRTNLGDQAVTTGAVLGSVADSVPRNPKTGELPTANVLGGWLKARDGRFFGDLKPVRVWDSHRCQNTWRVDVHQRAPAGHPVSGSTRDAGTAGTRQGAQQGPAPVPARSLTCAPAGRQGLAGRFPSVPHSARIAHTSHNTHVCMRNGKLQLPHRAGIQISPCKSLPPGKTPGQSNSPTLRRSLHSSLRLPASGQSLSTHDAWPRPRSSPSPRTGGGRAHQQAARLLPHQQDPRTARRNGRRRLRPSSSAPSERHPAPLQLRGSRRLNGRSGHMIKDRDQEESMADQRFTASSIADDELDRLYEERAELLAELSGRDAEARERWIQRQRCGLCQAVRRHRQLPVPRLHEVDPRAIGVPAGPVRGPGPVPRSAGRQQPGPRLAPRVRPAARVGRRPRSARARRSGRRGGAVGGHHPRAARHASAEPRGQCGGPPEDGGRRGARTHAVGGRVLAGRRGVRCGHP